jgi:hypothetical protein
VDPDTGEAFVATAVHRFGNKDSIPVDNWSRGGLSSRIDLETGELGPGATYPRHGEVIFHDDHPDTGTRIRGVCIPGWSQLKHRLLDMAQAWSFIPYVGWDIIVADDDTWLLEGNNYSDVNLLQVHGPLLRDPRVRRFYRYHGVNC